MASLDLMFGSPEEQRLMEALARQMETVSIEKVSVSALLKEAGMSRATFYRWYRDKYDLLNRNYQLLLDRTLCGMTKGVSYKQATLQIYGTLRSSPAFYRNALSTRGQNSLYRYIYDQSQKTFETLMKGHGIPMEEPYYQMLLTGFLTGTLEITCLWAKSGMKETPEELLHIFFQLMPEDFRTYISLYHM